MIFRYSLEDNIYKIDFSKNKLYIWKYSASSLSSIIRGFWMYEASAKISKGKLNYNWGINLPFKLKKHCEILLFNKAFW